MLESYRKLQPTPKTVPEFKDAFQLICGLCYQRKPLSTLNAVKDYRKRLQACVSAMVDIFNI